jgi:hypothetical protein
MMIKWIPIGCLRRIITYRRFHNFTRIPVSQLSSYSNRKLIDHSYRTLCAYMSTSSSSQPSTTTYSPLPISMIHEQPAPAIPIEEYSWVKLEEAIKGHPKCLIVLDDDPTGCQTVYNVDLLLDYSIDSIIQQFHRKSNVFYILTNTRSLPEDQVRLVITQVMENIIAAKKQVGYEIPIQVISRCDSTLRGHFPLETRLIKAFLPELQNNNQTKSTSKPLAQLTVFIPAFFDGGRVTLNDIHYVIENEQMIPAGTTAFAKDAHFGYQSSNLLDYVMEKYHAAKVSLPRVISISLADLRKGGPTCIARKLRGN